MVKSKTNGYSLSRTKECQNGYITQQYEHLKTVRLHTPYL